MNISLHTDSQAAYAAAADLLAGWLVAPEVRNLMLPGGNTPLPLYQLIAARRLALSHLTIFALDEYLGVPPGDPRNCANLIRRTAVEPWGVRAERYFSVSSDERESLASALSLEQKLQQSGGLDVIVLGVGQNGHLGFNEPGSAEHSSARVVNLDAVSIAANRAWFDGDYAPTRGATTGLKTILAARRILALAFGRHKAAAVRAMTQGPRSPKCPASLLQGHPDATLFLDRAAAGEETHLP